MMFRRRLCIFNTWLFTSVFLCFIQLNKTDQRRSYLFNETFGHIELTTTSYNNFLCNWEIQNAGINEAIVFISVPELNLHNCSEFVKIINGNGVEVLYHLGCVSFAPEILSEVPFGQSNNISIQLFTQSSGSSIKMKFAILKKGLTTAIPVFGWNVTIYNPTFSSFTLRWAMLNTVSNQSAEFYIVEVKGIQGIILTAETVPGNTTTAVIEGLRPFTKYRVSVFGVDRIGLPYKSLESVTITKKVFCGSRPMIASRIVGGTVAAANSWPWQVMLADNSGSQFCGGSLVDPYWAVTAAHCVVDKTPSSLKIRLGAQYRTNGSVGTEQDIRVADIIIHENFDNPLRFSNDIALINLGSPANLGKGVGLVCLPDTSNTLTFDNITKRCWITGWGILSLNGSSPNTLMQASLPLVSKQKCTDVNPGRIDDSMLCAGLDEGGVDSCKGDSGGPLVCKFNGTWFLEGVTSWGQGCALANKFAVYANVRNLKSWLSTNMYTTVEPSVSPQNQSSSALVWCNFDHGLCSGWNQSSSDDFDWTLASGSTPSSSTGPTTGHGGSGYYMYIETSSPRGPSDNAKLELSVSRNGELSCLIFYYHMYGMSMGTLNVFSGNEVVFSNSGNQGNQWMKAERTIHLNNTVIFEGIVGSSYTGDLGIDDVSIINGSCPGHTAPTSTSARNSPTTSTFNSTTSKSTSTPITPSLKEEQESVLLEVRELDVKKWNEQVKNEFKRTVAKAATDFCAVHGNRCLIAPTSSRRKWSSNKMVFTSDLVHILPGYPKQSPSNSLMWLLAFYLQLPQGFSNNIVNKDALIDIVKSDKSNIERSIGSNITSVQPLLLRDISEVDNKSDKETTRTGAIIGASVGGVCLIFIIGAFVRWYKKTKGYVYGRPKKEIIYGGSTSGSSTYYNKAYVIE